MGSMSNLKQNISPRARLMIVLTVASVVGIVGFSVYRLSNNDNKIMTGGADIHAAPDSRDISRDRPEDEIIFGSDTQIGQLYETTQKEKAEEAIEKGDTHVDRLRLSDVKSTHEEANETKEESRAPVSPVQSRLDSLLAERKRLEEEQRVQEQARQAQQSQARMQENPWKAFLDQEKSRFSGVLDTSRLKQASSFTGIPTPTVTVERKEQKAPDRMDQPRTTVSTSTPVDSDSDRIARSIARLTGRPVAEKPVAADYPSERLSNQITQKEPASGKVIVGDTFMAVLQIGVNTDEISTVKATIVEKGPLEGAVLVGTPSRVGEKAHIGFDSMGLKRKGYSINAVALDPDTYRSAVADGVDRHTLSRWGSLGLAAFVEGYADAMTTSQTVNSSDGSSTTTRDGLPNSSDQAKYAIGNIGRRAVPLMEQQFSRPPTVTVEANRVIMIMFTSEVNLDEE